MKNSLRKALLLEYITLGWNIACCVIIITAAVTSSSTSLFGFGIDSVIEVFASLIVIWQLKAINRNKEKIAMRLIGLAFLLLGTYLIIQSVIDVRRQVQSYPSPAGIIWLSFTAIAMFMLAFSKRSAGIAINNAVVIKEAKVTLIDGLLALAVLTGLLCTKYFEWWWADVAAGIILAIYCITEAINAFW